MLDVMEHGGLHSISLTSARTQSIVALVEHCVSSRVVSLAQGALAAMLTEKLKWIAVAVVTPSLVLVAAGTALIAGSRPGAQGNDPQPIVRLSEGAAQRTVEKKARDSGQEEAELDVKANSLEKDKVEAELLEMETEALQKTLQQVIAQRLSPPFGGFMGGGPAGDKLHEQLEQHEAMQRRRVDEFRESFRHKRLQLAKLKRQIARESKELGQSEAETPTLTEMSQRLRTLETKVDRILDAVSKSPR
jgi:hypothetical protein